MIKYRKFYEEKYAKLSYSEIWYKNNDSYCKYIVRHITVALNHFLLKDKPAIVLDIGCADGYFTEFLSRHQLQAIGIDINKMELVRALKKASSFTEYILCDAQYLPFRDSVFDAVVCMHVLEHLPDDTKCIEEMSRVLKSQGTLVLAYPNEKGLWSRFFKRMLVSSLQEILNGTARTEHLRIYSYSKIIKLLKKGSFMVENIYCYGLKFPKNLATRFLARYLPRLLQIIDFLISRNPYICESVILKAKKCRGGLCPVHRSFKR